ALELATKVVQTVATDGGHGTDRGPDEDRSGEQFRDGGLDARGAGVVDEVDLRHGAYRGADPEAVEQLQVLERLSAWSVVGSDDEQRRVDLAGADEHVAHEPVVPRDVDEVELVAVVQSQMRVADVDRHAPPSLLRQAVGVDAGERAEERSLAVVDVTGRADDDGHRRSVAASPVNAVPSAATRRGSSTGSTVRRSTTTPPASARATSGGSPVLRWASSFAASPPGADSRTPADASVSVGRDPPPTVASRSAT